MSQHHERFKIQDLGQHTAEYDRVDGTLRLSWSGAQTFLDQAEALLLRNLLNQVLPAPAHSQGVPDLWRRPRPSVLEQRTEYQDRVLAVVQQRLLLADGREVTRTVAQLPPRVMILPIRGDGLLLAIEEYNFGAQRWQLTLPGGKVEGNVEDRAGQANLELQQEVGYRAGSMTALIAWQSDPGVVAQAVYAFVAQNLTWSPQPGDPHEDVRVHPLSLDEALASTRVDYQWDVEAAFALWTYASTQQQEGR